MKNDVLFAIKVLPKIGESYMSFLVRVALRNGWSSVNEALSVVKIMPIKSHSHFIRAIPALNIALKIHDGSLIDAFTGGFSHHYYDSARSIRNIEIASVRLCPECTKNNGVLDVTWNLLPVTHCQEHRRALIDTCPICNKSLTWHAMVGVKCGFCNFEWLNAEVVHEDTPEYQREFLSSQTNVTSWLRRFTDALLVVLRPFDNLMISLERVPEIPRLNEYIRAAYELLTDQATQIIFAKNVCQTRCTLIAVSSKAVQLPLARLEMETFRVGDLVLEQNDKPMLPEVDSVIPLKRKKLVSCGMTASDLNDHVNADQIISVFGISKQTLGMLVEANVINPVNRTAVTRDLLFLLSSIATIFSKIPTFSDHRLLPHESISMEAASRLSTVYGGNTDLLKFWAISGKIIAYRLKDSPDELGSIWVDMNSLKVELDAYLDDLLNGDLAIALVAKILNIHINTVEELVELGLLARSKWYRYGEKLAGTSLRIFMSQHFCLDRWGKLNFESISRLQNILNKNNFLEIPLSKKKRGSIYPDKCIIESMLNKSQKKKV
nr:hypothetical protein [uncultured Tolumonas sp.]